MARLQLRPMNVGEVLNASLTVYRQRLRTLLAVAGMLILPYAVLYLLLAEPPPELPVFATPEEIQAALAPMIPWLLIRLFITTILLAAVARVVVETYVGVRSTWRQAAAAAISRMLSLAIITILFWGAVLLDSALLVIPGVFLLVCLCISLPAQIIEGVDPFVAVRRSWKLTAGRRWHVLVVLLVSSLLVLLASLVAYVGVGSVLLRLQGDLGLLLASELSWVAFQPFLGVALAVMYLDLCVRKEDLDTDRLSLQLLATSFDR